MSNKVQHTPGPWHCETYPTNEKDGQREVLIGDGLALASIWDIPNGANARLIAAAPDLLVACKDMEAAESMRYDAATYPGRYSRAMRALRAAIAKAEGSKH